MLFSMLGSQTYQTSGFTGAMFLGAIPGSSLLGRDTVDWSIVAFRAASSESTVGFLLTPTPASKSRSHLLLAMIRGCVGFFSNNATSPPPPRAKYLWNSCFCAPPRRFVAALNPGLFTHSQRLESSSSPRQLLRLDVLGGGQSRTRSSRKVQRIPKDPPLVTPRSIPVELPNEEPGVISRKT